MVVDLYSHQKEALPKLSNGKILCGGVGSGKSLTSLAYYVEKESPKDIYIITTAKKRDSLDWEGDAAKFIISPYSDSTAHGVLTVDSWNNIRKYEHIEDAFYIFDEQRLVGSGAWTKSFLKIAKKNNWILLSATPGDTWLDYIPVFVANGFYKNRTQFKLEHVVYNNHAKYPKVERYLGEAKLNKLRRDILVEMAYEKRTRRHLREVPVDANKEAIQQIYKKRWDPFEDRPLKDISDVFRAVRKVANSDPSRLQEVRRILKKSPKLIIFYNFDYELEILRTLSDSHTVAEWNGHKHESIPQTDEWVYLVQYTAGAEGWNCVETNAMCFYSLQYSYKIFEQSQGRTDRLNTPFTDLVYYILMSKDGLDGAIWKSLKAKETFNERRYAKS